MPIKRCTHCFTEQNHDQFHANNQSADGKASWCKSCVKTRYNRQVAKTKTESYFVRESIVITKMVQRAKARAAEKGLEFTITEADIIIPDTCPALHMKLSIEDGNRDTSPSIDRINSNLGYTKDNITVMSNRANTLKSNGSVKELMWVAEFCRDMAVDKEKALKGERIYDIDNFMLDN